MIFKDKIVMKNKWKKKPLLKEHALIKNSFCFNI
jgi:hypothetical protein